MFYIMFGLAIVSMIAMIVYFVKVRKSMINKAKKIDPTVKNGVEADYVLYKDIVQSVGQGNNKAYCKECGAEIDADSKFCKKCGKQQ